jgi:hypothetical protein
MLPRPSEWVESGPYEALILSTTPHFITTHESVILENWNKLECRVLQNWDINVHANHYIIDTNVSYRQWNKITRNTSTVVNEHVCLYKTRINVSACSSKPYEQNYWGAELTCSFVSILSNVSHHVEVTDLCTHSKITDSIYSNVLVRWVNMLLQIAWCTSIQRNRQVFLKCCRKIF